MTRKARFKVFWIILASFCVVANIVIFTSLKEGQKGLALSVLNGSVIGAFVGIRILNFDGEKRK